MGSWSSSAPSLPAGSSWSSASNTGSCYDEYYKAYASVSIARGTGDTIYVRFVLYSYLKQQGQGARSFPVKCQLSVGGSADETSGNVACGGVNYGYYQEVGTRYYTGTAAPGTSVACRVLQDHDSTKAYLSAPAYVTAYAVTYDGNGADSGATESQSKLYNDSVTIRECGFVKEHFGFLEWNTAADGTGTRYMPGASYATNAALALYAIWEKATVPVYVSDGDGIYEADAVYVNADGEICECAVYVNIDGEIKEIV